MTEEVDSRILGLDPSDTNKANDLNSFILGDTDDWSLDQIEVNTNISSLLPFPEEGKGIQIAIETGCQLKSLRNYFGQNQQSCSWSKVIAWEFIQRFRVKI